jgi:hypothetical protein
MMRGSTVIADLERVANDMRTGDYRESDAAVLITRDSETGFITICFPGTDAEDGRRLLREAQEIGISIRRSKELANAAS